MASHPVDETTDLAPSRFATPPPAERAPEWPLISGHQTRRTTLPHPFEEEQDIASSHFAAPPTAERAPERSSVSAAESRCAEAPPPFESQLEPEPPHSATAPQERQRHWSALYEEVESGRIEPDMDSRRTTPPPPVERKTVRSPEPPSTLTENLRIPATPSLERSREWAPLSATEPKRTLAPRPFETQPAPESPRAVAPAVAPVEPAPVHATMESEEDDDDSESSHEPVFPKLLRRLKTVGRAALPVVPHVLPKEGKIGAAVSTVTAGSNVLVSQSTQQTQAALPGSPAPPADRAPIGDNLDVLRAAHKDLRDKVHEQSAMLERVEVQMQILCESVNHTEREQRDLVDELKFFSKWALVFAVAVGVLMMAAVGFDVVLILRQ